MGFSPADRPAALPIRKYRSVMPPQDYTFKTVYHGLNGASIAGGNIVTKRLSLSYGENYTNACATQICTGLITIDLLII